MTKGGQGGQWGKSKKGKKNTSENSANNDVGEEMKRKPKVMFLCKLCTKPYLTHYFPKMEEAQKFLNKELLSNPLLFFPIHFLPKTNKWLLKPTI